MLRWTMTQSPVQRSCRPPRGSAVLAQQPQLGLVLSEPAAPGFGLANMTDVEDDALDRCYSESGQDSSQAVPILDRVKRVTCRGMVTFA